MNKLYTIISREVGTTSNGSLRQCVNSLTRAVIEAALLSWIGAATCAVAWSLGVHTDFRDDQVSNDDSKRLVNSYLPVQVYEVGTFWLHD